jgi:L-lactate utilization protein LutB|tara:strand:+ start:286 stop:522 length:237 start_codon:yes stop_codon:yes gene_type:complete
MIKTKREAKEIKAMSYDNDTEIALLKKDVNEIKNNHLAHMKDDIDRIEKKVDKIDNRIWWILGILVSTQLAGMIAQML